MKLSPTGKIGMSILKKHDCPCLKSALCGNFYQGYYKNICSYSSRHFILESVRVLK